MLGMTLVSHVPDVANGIFKLLDQVASDVPITTAAGTNDNDIGTSLDKIIQAFNDNAADEILAFYDLGSAKMNIDMAIEMTEKKVHVYNAAFIEGSYTAASLLEANVSLTEIEKQLEPLIVKE